MFGYSLPIILFKLNQITDMLLFIIIFFYYTYIIIDCIVIIKYMFKTESFSSFLIRFVCLHCY